MPPEKDKGAAPSPEIARLSALLAKDPKSKLFIPLAEEYLKAGMRDEAITTLEAGLGANPFYMSARVLLGRAYMDKGGLDKARDQFEQVVKSAPDNILAHKKLAEIYKEQGRREDAMRSVRILIALNPKDEEAKALLAALEAGPAAGVGEPPAEAAEGGPALQKQKKAEAAPPGLPVFDISEVGSGPAEDEEAEQRPSVMEMPTLEMETLQSRKAPHRDDSPPQKGRTGYAVDLSSGGLNDLLSSYDDVLPEEEAAPAAGVYEISDDISGLDMDVTIIRPALATPAPRPAPGPVEKEIPAPARPETQPSGEAFETETLAELYISQGFYDRAINIYRHLVAEDPANSALRQKLEDLYSLAGLSSTKAAEKNLRQMSRDEEAAPLPEFGEAPEETSELEAALFEQEAAPPEVWDAPFVPEPTEDELGTGLVDQDSTPLEAWGAVGLGGPEYEIQEEFVPAEGFLEAGFIVEDAGRAGLDVDFAAINRLEQFLERIRRKVGR